MILNVTQQVGSSSKASGQHSGGTGFESGHGYSSSFDILCDFSVLPRKFWDSILRQAITVFFHIFSNSLHTCSAFSGCDWRTRSIDIEYNKQHRAADKGWSYRLGIGRRGIIIVKNSLLRNVMLRNSNSSPNTIGMMKARELGWAGQISRMRAKRNTKKILVRKLYRKRRVRRLPVCGG